MDESKNISRLIEARYPGILLSDILNPFRYPPAIRLLLLLILPVVLLLLSLDYKNLENKGDPVLSDAVEDGGKSRQSLSLPELPAILQVVSGRKIFKAPAKPPPPPMIRETGRKGPGITEQLKQLVFLGTLGENPKQAIIESKSTSETYYVKEGETLFDLEVIAIADDQVTFQYQDEKGILR